MDTDFDRLVLEEIRDAVVVTTLDSRIAHWTRSATVFGYAADVAVGRSLAFLIVPGDRQDEERRHFEGTGLGLYLSQKHATLIRGKLSFTSNFGTGSSFSLALPALKR